jgi:hypothetical protein
MWVYYIYIMDNVVNMALNNLLKHPVAPGLGGKVENAVNQHLKTMQFIAQKIEYLQKIIRIINNTIIPNAVDKATTKTHKDLIRTTIAPLATSLQNKIHAFQAENVPDGDILQLELGLHECGNLIREANANKEIPMHALPPNLLENLLKCQKSATQAIQRLDLMVNSRVLFAALSGEKKKEATRVLNLYGPNKLNLPEKAKAWADYFKARHEHARVEMENWGVSSTAALPSAERTPAGTTKKAVSYGDTISNVKTDHVPRHGGKRKTRKRKRKRKTRKRRKKKKTKRKHKKRHRRTRRR